MSRRTMLKSTAAAGLLGTGLTGTASADDWHEVTLCAAGDDLFTYRVKFSGGVKRGGTYQSDDGDKLTELSVDGAVSEGRCDSFLFKGEIADYDLDGPGTLAVDGKVVEDTSDEDVDDKVREVTFCAAGDDLFSYRVEVSGKMMRGGTYQSDSGDKVGANFAEGRVAEGRCDSFLWTGKVKDLKVNGPGVVKVDGKVVEDTTRDGDAGKLDKVAIVSSPGTDELMNYVFEVTGDLENLEPNEDSGPAVDNVSRTDGRVRVEGAVSTGDDRYAFSGDLLRIDVPDAVRIDVRGR